MKRALFCGVMLLFLGVPAATAMPGTSGKNDKFATADTNKNGYLNREEFAKAFSGLKPEAFDFIDKDKDGKIVAEEWKAFSSGHGGHASGQTAPPAKKETLPIEPAPQKPQRSGK
jgi:hypothetical protein